MAVDLSTETLRIGVDDEVPTLCVATLVTPAESKSGG